ncbi:MAG: serine--tRNA ligase, partial [Balneolaceae bacterium]|nr:serine--tRNA ligase [Balneolaceae bacterium]
MLDVSFIRENSARVKEGMKQKGEADTSLVDRVLEVDEQWRSLLQEVEQLRSESNTKAKEIGKLMGEGQKEEAQKIIEHTSELKQEIKEKEENLRKLKKERDQLLLQIPNVPHDSVPVGETEEDNEVFKTWGEPVEKDWRVPHWELAESSGWIDFERGA